MKRPVPPILNVPGHIVVSRSAVEAIQNLRAAHSCYAAVPVLLLHNCKHTKQIISSTVQTRGEYHYKTTVIISADWVCWNTWQHDPLNIADLTALDHPCWLLFQQSSHAASWYRGAIILLYHKGSVKSLHLCFASLFCGT